MTLAAGNRLGTYEILGPLGAGGMGEVYRAKDLRLGREVAVKVLPTEVATNPDRLARFEREARTVAGLNHPNIVTLHSVEDEEGTRFLTMELVEGQTLRDLVTLGGLPLPQILELAIPLTEALAAAHERGVIHRDLKPSNVMVTRDGRVKVLDFGLAKMTSGDVPARGAALDPAVASTITGEPHLLGTVPYMAPEVIRGGVADSRTDIFAFGVILYELSTGRRPFTGVASADVWSSILRDIPEPVTRVRADLPSDLDGIVSRCLEKNPRDRFGSALELTRELRRLGRDLERGELAIPQKAILGEEVVSIAVLPFVNRSADADDEYFSDGLADELLNVLAKIRGLRVAARTSSFQFRATKDDLATIGRKLNVATLLEGSVRKAGNRVRISVQLVKVSDGFHLWSETYDRTLEDIFAVQDDITQSVVRELRTALLGEEADPNARGQVHAEVARAAKGRTTDPEAHRLFLLARHLIDQYTREETAKAIVYLKEALDRDSRFALAWSELSRGYAREAGRGWARAAEGYERARGAANRSLALEPDLAEGHAGLGYIRISHDWDWRGGEASYARALELAPGNPQVLRGVGGLMLYLGRLDEAIGLYRRALEQDPLSPAAYNNLAVALHALGRFGDAEEARRKALEFAPLSGALRATLSETLLAQGRSEEALSEAMREPDEIMRLWAVSIAHHAAGHVVESDAALRDLIGKHANECAYQVAEIHGARGEKDAAFQWLERAYTQRDSGLVSMKTSSYFGSLRDDPRWPTFLKKMGLG
jgi:serine/threonine protein kinase/tetratricopeptide (TPR) repeat protein